MAMVPADLVDYGGQIEELRGVKHRLIERGATKDEQAGVDRSLEALLDAAAAQQKQWFSPEQARARDYERDGGRRR